MPTTNGRYDGPPIVVIGAGPVGQTTALLLAKWGVPAVLLDRRSGRDPVGSRSICQHRDVLDIWAAVGVGERIAEEGVTWQRARTFFRDRELFAIELPDPGHSPFPPFVNISQSRTEELLDERIAAEPLVEVLWNHRVVAIDQSVDEVAIRSHTAGGDTTLRAPYVVACGGARADDLRDQLGVSFEGTSFDDQFLICDVATDLPDSARERRFYFDPVWNPGRQVLIHPCPNSTYRIDWQVPPDFDLEAAERSGALDRLIRHIVGDRSYDVVWRSLYRFESRHADRLRVGRVLLAGDLAHALAPFGARGLNSGVQDAENAAWKLAFVLHGWAPMSLLETYHDERLAAALENLDVTTATMRFLVPQTEAERQARTNVLERAEHDPAARALVDSGRLAEPYWYPDSPLTTPDPTRPCGGRPERGETPTPGPGVLVPDLPVHSASGPTRLRALVRDGLLALTTGGVGVGTVESALQASTAAATRVLPLTDAAAAEALGSRPGEVWLLRPDGHVAAVVSPDAVAAAVYRTVGLTARQRPS